MKHQTDTFTAGDGLSIHCQSWLPESPTAVVILSHGYGEHSGRYQHVVDPLVGQGYAVYALDHRGHGQSGGQKGYVANFPSFVDDLHRYIQQIKVTHPDLPRVLFAHSMGGAIALRYVLEHRNQIDMMVLSAPYLIDGGNVSPMLFKISRLLGMLVPQLPIKAIDSSMISRDPKVIKDYDDDPLNSREKIRARTGSELLSSGPIVFERAKEITVPVLLMHGDADALASVNGSRKLFELIGSEDKSLKIYDGLYHEILNEPEKTEVINDSLAWIGQRV